MQRLIRNVHEIDAIDRRALERLLGESLRDDQQLMIKVVDPTISQETPDEIASLPSWCNVYEGLSEDEIADLERTIMKRADLSRELD